MSTRAKPVQAAFTEWVCQTCHQDVLRVGQQTQEPGAATPSAESVSLECCPVTWQASCHRCGYPYELRVPGHYLVYDGRRFVLYESVEEKLNELRRLVRDLSRRPQ